MLAPGERACPSCTSITDGIDGELRHVTQKTNYAVCVKAPIEEFRAHAQTRGGLSGLAGHRGVAGP